MIWPNSMKKRWFRRFVSLVSLTLGNSVSWGKLRISSTVEHIRKMSSSPLGNILFFGVGNFYTNDSWYYSNLELEDKNYAYGR